MADKIVIDLKQDAFDAFGDPVVLKLGERRNSLADVLRKQFFAASSPDTKPDIMRYMGWCNDLEVKQSLELSSADFEVIQKMILDSRSPLQLKGPLIMAMHAAKDASEKVE